MSRAGPTAAGGGQSGTTATEVGTVAEFDAERGFGTVTGENGGDSLFFHCTAIADGSREIEAGVRVRYRVVAGHLGRWEAKGLTPEV